MYLLALRLLVINFEINLITRICAKRTFNYIYQAHMRIYRSRFLITRTLMNFIFSIYRNNVWREKSAITFRRNYQQRYWVKMLVNPKWPSTKTTSKNLEGIIEIIFINLCAQNSRTWSILSRHMFFYPFSRVFSPCWQL